MLLKLQRGLNDSTDPDVKASLLSKNGQEDINYIASEHEQIQQSRNDGEGDYASKVVNQEMNAQSSHGSNMDPSSVTNNLLEESVKQQEAFQQSQQVEEGQLATMHEKEQRQQKDRIGSEQKQKQISVVGERPKTEETQQKQEGEVLSGRPQVLAIKDSDSQSDKERNDQRNIMAELELEKFKAQAQAQAQAAVEDAKLANQKVQVALSDYNNDKNNVQAQEANQETIYNNNLPPTIEQLLVEAKIADDKASAAVGSYNELRKAAEKSVQEFNAKFAK